MKLHSHVHRSIKISMMFGFLASSVYAAGCFLRENDVLNRPSTPHLFYSYKGWESYVYKYDGSNGFKKCPAQEGRPHRNGYLTDVFPGGDEFEVTRYVQYENHHFFRQSYMPCEIAEWVMCHPTNISDSDSPFGGNLLAQYPPSQSAAMTPITRGLSSLKSLRYPLKPQDDGMCMPSESEESESDNGKSPTESLYSVTNSEASQSCSEPSQSSYEDLTDPDIRPDRVRLNVFECRHMVQKNPRVKKLLPCCHRFKATKDFDRWGISAFSPKCPKCHNDLSGENIKKFGHVSIPRSKLAETDCVF